MLHANDTRVKVAALLLRWHCRQIAVRLESNDVILTGTVLLACVCLDAAAHDFRWADTPAIMPVCEAKWTKLSPPSERERVAAVAHRDAKRVEYC